MGCGLEGVFVPTPTNQTQASQFFQNIVFNPIYCKMMSNTWSTYRVKTKTKHNSHNLRILQFSLRQTSLATDPVISRPEISSEFPFWKGLQESAKRKRKSAKKRSKLAKPELVSGILGVKFPYISHHYLGGFPNKGGQFVRYEVCPNTWQFRK